MKKALFATIIVLALYGFPALAETNHETSGHGGHGQTFLWMALILIAACIGRIVEKKKQPAVLGEILIGVVLGNLGLLGIHIFEPIKQSYLLEFMAEFGVGLLLFKIGLESSVGELTKVGKTAFIVAVAGVVAPFASGYLASIYWFGLSTNTSLFIGATLTATSVGITARVLSDLGKIKTKESQIILGAAVIDDILGLIILAAVSAIVKEGSVSIASLSFIIFKAVVFLGLSLFIGIKAAPNSQKCFKRFILDTA